MRTSALRASASRPSALRAVAIAIVAVLALAVPTATWAASSASPESFQQLISGMQLVILAKISGSETQGYTYTVEQVLQGSAGPSLTFPPDPQAAVQPGWTEAVVAFSNLTTDDFRAPTIAWHVGADGTIDPEKFQQYPGLPATLTDMLAFFGVSASASPSAGASIAASAAPSIAPTASPAAVASATAAPATNAPSSGLSSTVLLLALLALLVLVVVLALLLRRRPRA